MVYSLVWEPKGVHAKFSGQSTVVDVQRAYEAISRDPRSDQLRYAIFDYLDVEPRALERQEVEQVAAFAIGLAVSLPEVRYASVATDERIVALWRHFVSVQPTPERHGVFPSVSAARDWLAARPPGPSHSAAARPS